MSLISVLNLLYPDAVPGEDYVLRNDGDGDYISEWALSNTKPTDDEIKAAMTSVESKYAWDEYQAKAQALLDKTDLVCIRCYKAGVQYPATWQTYTENLRAIVSAKSGDPTVALPLIPDFPAGT